MRLVHFVETGRMAGGIERYLQSLLSCPDGDLEHAVVMDSGEECAFRSRWPARTARWRAGAPAGPDERRRLRALVADLDGVAILHDVPAAETLEAWRLEHGPLAVFCHGSAWWCASASRYHARLEKPCAIQASTFRCSVRYHALRCGGVRLGPLLSGVNRASTGRRALAAVDAILVASNYMRREVAQHGAPSDRIHLLPLPSAFAGLGPAAEPGPPATVLFASRLTPLKGIGLMLEAFGMITGPARLVIAGSGISEREVAAAVQSHPARAQIELVGNLGSEALREAMSRAALVVVPSLWPEPFGLVGIEALAMGRPVVATDVGGIPDWARPELGALVVPSPDPRLLARAIDRVLEEPSWRVLARSRGAAWVAERHSLEAHVSALKAALRPLLHT